MQQRETVEHAILGALATYRFLTSKQLLELGVTADKSYLHERLRALCRRTPHAIRKLEFGRYPTLGRLHDVYLLTEAGARLHDLKAFEAGEMLVPTCEIPWKNDYFHRLSCVDFHMALARWAESNSQQITFYDTYFDPVRGSGKGGKAKAVTSIKLSSGTVVPDAVFMLTDGLGKKRLCVLEVAKGWRTDRVVKQLARYTVAFREKAIQKACESKAGEYSSGVRLLLVVDDEKAFELIQERVLNRHKEVFTSLDLGLMFVRLSEGLADNFDDDWKGFDGDGRTLF